MKVISNIWKSTNRLKNNKGLETAETQGVMTNVSICETKSTNKTWKKVQKNKERLLKV